MLDRPMCLTFAINILVAMGTVDMTDPTIVSFKWSMEIIWILFFKLQTFVALNVLHRQNMTRDVISSVYQSSVLQHKR